MQPPAWSAVKTWGAVSVSLSLMYSKLQVASMEDYTAIDYFACISVCKHRFACLLELSSVTVQPCSPDCKCFFLCTVWKSVVCSCIFVHRINFLSDCRPPMCVLSAVGSHPVSTSHTTCVISLEVWTIPTLFSV